jgi:hypothetical protein
MFTGGARLWRADHNRNQIVFQLWAQLCRHFSSARSIRGCREERRNIFGSECQAAQELSRPWLFGNKARQFRRVTLSPLQCEGRHSTIQHAPMMFRCEHATVCAWWSIRRCMVQPTGRAFRSCQPVGAVCHHRRGLDALHLINANRSSIARQWRSTDTRLLLSCKR